MKKKILFIAFSAITFLTVKAQGPYAGFGVGYGMPACISVLGYESYESNPANTFSMEIVKGSYGKGLNFGGYFGYNIGEYVGFELGVNYLMGSKYTFINNDINGNSTTDRTNEVSVKSLRLNPAIRISIGDGKLRPFMRGGIAIGVMNKMTDKYRRTFTDPGITDITLETTEFSGGTYVGLTGALGVNFMLNDNIFLFAELTNYFSSWAPTEGEIVESTFNGVDQLGNMTTDEKQVEFVDKVDQSMNTSSSQPSVALKTYVPMSSIGITVGMHFAFGGK